MPGRFCIQDFRYRIKRIHLGQGVIAAKTQGFLIGRSLVMIEITRRFRCHHHIVSLIGSINTPLYSAPAHHCGFWRQSAFEYFIPPQQNPVLRVYKFLYPLNKIALQFTYIFQSFGFYPQFTFRAFCPFRFCGFISSNMDIFGRKQVDHFT